MPADLSSERKEPSTVNFTHPNGGNTHGISGGFFTFLGRDVPISSIGFLPLISDYVEESL
jgi:hypothetical protein